MLVSCTGHLINDRYYRTYLQTAAQKQIRMPPTQNIPRAYLLLLRELDTACTDSPESLVIFFFLPAYETVLSNDRWLRYTSQPMRMSHI